MNENDQFYAGTSGLQIPIPKKDFPEIHKNRSRLSYYSLLFNSIEINSSFYKMPQPSTLKKWCDEVNSDFQFSFKLWRGITHQKQLLFDSGDVEKFMHIIGYVSPKAGCLLIQMPPRLDIYNYSNLEKLLSLIKRFNKDWKIAIEFRNRSWYVSEVYELLSEYDAGLVLHDLPGSGSPLIKTSPKFVYLRFHGPEGRYRGSYSDDILYEYSVYIKEWLQSGSDTYTYFNNTMGEALSNLMTLKKYIYEKAP